MLKLPPPLVALLLAGAMWAAALVTQPTDLPDWVRWVLASAVALIGVGFSGAGVASFRRAKTTLNPMKPETASSLVTSGLYAHSRNPMYVGVLTVLIAWAVFLSSLWALGGPLVFFMYMNRVQIPAEERALSHLFGAPYADYRARVRRWL